MPTQAQSDAARANGAKSRGPVTAEGKARSSKNAVKHYAYAESLLLDNESFPAFQELMDDYIAKFRPADETEMRVVDRLAAATWREQRLLHFEAATLNMIMVRQRPAFELQFTRYDEATRGAVAYSAAVCEDKSFESLQRAIAECGRQFARALRDLEKMRKIAPDPAPRPHPEPEPEMQKPETGNEPTIDVQEPEPQPETEKVENEPKPEPAPQPQPAPEPTPTPEIKNEPKPTTPADPPKRRLKTAAEFAAENAAILRRIDALCKLPQS